jgi:hypothetical protein
MEDNDAIFWIKFWKIAGLITVGLSIVVAGCVQSTNAKKVKLVEAGYTPIEANCAFSDTTNTVCIQLAEKAK